MAQTFSSKGYTAALGLFFVVLAAYSIFQSPLFQLQQIDLVGAERLTEADVLTWTGLTLGENLFDLDTVSIAQRLRLASHGRGRPGKPAFCRRPCGWIWMSAGPSPSCPRATPFGRWTPGAMALFESEALTLALPLVTLDANLNPTAGRRSRIPGCPWPWNLRGP